MTVFQGSSDALVVAAVAERRKGNLLAAASLLFKATNSGATNGHHYNLLGNVLGDLGRVEEADQAYARAVELEPHHPDAWINRGNLQIGRDDERAVQHLRKACEIAPRSVLAWLGLGKVLRALGRYDESIAAFERARRIDPDRATTPIQLGLTHVAAGRTSKGIQAYDAAEKAGHAIPELFDNRAAARIQAGDIEGAASELDHLTSAYPGYAPGHRSRARLYWEYGIEGDPFSSYRRLAELHPDSAEVWLAWLTALASFRQYQALIEVERSARRAVGENSGMRFLTAVAYSETDDLEAASSAFAGLASAFGHDPNFLTAHARHSLRCREFSRAEALCERANHLAPLDQLAWAYRGLAWRLLDDPREGWLNDYDRMVAFNRATPPGESCAPGDFAEEIAGHLRLLHDARTHPAEQSLRGGTQTAGALFSGSSSWIRRLRAAAEAAIVRYIDRLPDDPSHPFLGRKASKFRFAGSWSVRLRRSGFHIAHVHPAGWISSAFYFVVPSRSSAGTKEGALALGAPPAELGLNLGPRKLVEPVPGYLCLFPSMFWHETTPFQSGDERLTVAFDAVPSGQERS